MRGWLAAMSCAVLCAACPTPSSLRSARPLGAGHREGGFQASLFARVSDGVATPGNPPVSFAGDGLGITNLDLYLRRGVTDRVDLGCSLGVAGVVGEVQAAPVATEHAASAVNVVAGLNPLNGGYRLRAGAATTLGRHHQLTLTAFYGLGHGPNADKSADAPEKITIPIVGGGLGYGLPIANGDHLVVGADVQRWGSGDTADVVVILGLAGRLWGTAVE